jgi:hypothetical protein
MKHGDDKKKRGGFEDIPLPERCRHPQHEPPMHMVIPPGKQYRHICPGCGREVLLRPPHITWSCKPSAQVHDAAKRLVQLLDEPEPGLFTWHELCQSAWKEMHA